MKLNKIKNPPLSYVTAFFVVLILVSCSKGGSFEVKTNGASCSENPNLATCKTENDPTTDDTGGDTSGITSSDKTGSAKLSADNCVDPDLTFLATTQSIMLCDGTIATGTLDLTNLVATNIKSGITVGSVSGTYSGSASTCTSDAEVGCITNATYTAALTTGLASKVLSTQTVAGVAGNITLPAAGNVYTGIQYGVGGTGVTGTLTIPTGANVRSGVGTYGVAGTGSTASLADCSTDGGTTCVATTNYPAAYKAGFIAGDVSDAVQIAGVAGTLHQCAADAGTSCIANTNYKAAKMSDVLQGNIRSTVTIAGVAGNVVVESHSNCGTDGATGCVATISYPAANNTNLVASNIKNGVTIGGVAGSKRDTKKCLNAADLATFDNRSASNLPITSGSFLVSVAADTISFGAGVPEAHGLATAAPIYVTTSNTMPAPLVSGTTYYAIIASSSSIKLATSAANASAGTAIDLTSQGSGSHTVSEVADSVTGIWDTIDDYNNNGVATASSPWAASYICNESNFSDVSGSSSSLTPPNTTPTQGNQSFSNIYQDNLSGTYFTNILYNGSATPATTWAESVTMCSALDSGDGTGKWHLPTQKELMQLYIDGISKFSVSGGTFSTSSIFWSSSVASNLKSYAWGVNFINGNTPSTVRTAKTNWALCVR